MATTLSLAPLFRQSVGFDRFNDWFFAGGARLLKLGPGR